MGVVRAVTGKQTNRIPFSSSCPLDSIASSIRQYMTFAVLLTGNPVNALGKGIQSGINMLKKFWNVIVARVLLSLLTFTFSFA